MMIRQAVDKIYKEKEQLDSELKRMQEACKHKNTHIKPYSYRPGSIVDVEMCVYCDHVIRTINPVYEILDNVKKTFISTNNCEFL